MKADSRMSAKFIKDYPQITQISQIRT